MFNIETWDEHYVLVTVYWVSQIKVKWFKTKYADDDELTNMQQTMVIPEQQDSGETPADSSRIGYT